VSLRLARTPDGRRIEVYRELDAPADRLWTLVTHTRHWPAWGPSVAAVDPPDAVVCPGLSGAVTLRGVGLSVPFRVETCTDRRWTWRVAGVPATGHRVEARPRGCRVVFEVPPVAAAYAVVCERALDRLADLARDPPPDVG
jgi:hypothetical protein